MPSNRLMSGIVLCMYATVHYTTHACDQDPASDELSLVGSVSILSRWNLKRSASWSVTAACVAPAPCAVLRKILYSIQEEFVGLSCSL